jgi:hypothetical protein
MPSTVATACRQFQSTLKKVWASGSTYSEMTLFLGVSKDQLFRLRDRLALPLRLDRAKRQKPPRQKDPTPQELAQRCAEVRARHLQQRLAEPAGRTYRKSEVEFVRFRLQERIEQQDDALERLIDDCGDQ